MSILASVGSALRNGASQGITQPLNRMMGYACNSAAPVSIPPVADLYDAYRRGVLTAEQLATMALFSGIDTTHWRLLGQGATLRDPAVGSSLSNTWAALLDARVQQITMADLIGLRLRGQLTDAQWATRTRELGWWRRSYLDEAMWIATNQMPGPADLVRFALRDCWDAAAVERFGYDMDFPAEFNAYMLQQGYGGDARTPAMVAAGDEEVTWAEMYWRAHWQTLSPSQCYEMYQRLRPERVARYAQDIKGLTAFTADDLATQLRINDYPAPTRPWLTAISYRRPRLVDIDRFTRTGAIDQEEAYQLHLDLGYSPADARMRTDWLLSQRPGVSSASDSKAAVRAVVALYTEGEYEYDYALDLCTRYLGQGKYLSYHAGVAAIPTDAGAFAVVDAARSAMQRGAMAIQLRGARALTSSWRRRYLRGQFSRVDIAADMARTGRTQTWIRDTLDVWDAELAGGRLIASTATVKKWVCEGLLTIAMGRQYLHNLGWRAPELEYHLEQAASGRKCLGEEYAPPSSYDPLTLHDQLPGGPMPIPANVVPDVPVQPAGAPVTGVT